MKKQFSTIGRRPFRTISVIVAIFVASLIDVVPAYAQYSFHFDIPVNKPSLPFPTGLAVDDNGNIHVVLWSADQIVKLRPDGSALFYLGEIGTRDGQFTSPGDVALDSAGNIYVADNGNNRIQKFDPDGNFLSNFGEEGFE